jgi:hypothetical protein
MNIYSIGTKIIFLSDPGKATYVVVDNNISTSRLISGPWRDKSKSIIVGRGDYCVMNLQNKQYYTHSTTTTSDIKIILPSCKYRKEI